MQYIEAPQTHDGDETSLFLAGGIAGCPDWQKEVVEELVSTSLVLLNPRRADFPIGDKSAARTQITWEHQYLRKATAISFWFPCETLNPIVLYELGAWSMTNKRIFIGVHPDYQRLQDVQIQTSLVRQDVRVVASLEELIEDIIAWERYLNFR
jgi:hypothetical protein